MSRRILEHCPDVMPGNGKHYIVAQSEGGWNGLIAQHDWVDGVLGGGTPVDSYELYRIRGGGGLYAWWEYEPNVKIEFRAQSSPVAYVVEPDPRPAPKPQAETPAVRKPEAPKKRGRPKKKVSK
jgi:hypothetical protein